MLNALSGYEIARSVTLKMIRIACRRNNSEKTKAKFVSSNAHRGKKHAGIVIRTGDGFLCCDPSSNASSACARL